MLIQNVVLYGGVKLGKVVWEPPEAEILEWSNILVVGIAVLAGGWETEARGLWEPPEAEILRWSNILVVGIGFLAEGWETGESGLEATGGRNPLLEQYCRSENSCSGWGMGNQ